MPDIFLSNGLPVQVSPEDMEWACQFRWHLCGDPGYAARNAKVEGGWTMLYMHREIARRSGFDIVGNHVDHKDLNRRSCRRDNLRCGPEALNHFNLPVRADSRTGVRGVCWDKSRGKWKVRVQRQGVSMARRFDNFDAAVQFRKDQAAEIYGGLSHVDH